MAVSSCILVVEGVLQKNVSLAPIPVGIALYHGLSNTFNLLLVSDSSQKELDYWLSLEALNKHSGVEYNEGLYTYMTTVERRVNQAKAFRTKGYHIDLVYEPDPSISAELLAEGFNVCTFTHAEYALPEWRPDYQQKPRGWDKIQKYEKQMAELRAMDTLLKEKADND